MKLFLISIDLGLSGDGFGCGHRLDRFRDALAFLVDDVAAANTSELVVKVRHEPGVIPESKVPRPSEALSW
jgi:hypothetical protein